jgi:ABC-type nitrate/sulfonate/bicarbonate transport system substrate-binding protein
MRKWIPAVLVIVAATVTAPAIAQTKVSIGTARDPNLGAQIVIAREKGFFKDAGLDADTKYFPSGGDLMSALVGGSVGYGTSGSTPVLTVLARPYPLRIIAQVSDISGAQQLIVKKNVDALDQLKGKKIGLMRGTASEALFNSIVRDYTFDPSSVQIVNMGPTEMITTFVRGDVDAVQLWEPHATKARNLGDGKILISGTTSFIGGKATPKRVYGDHAVLFASESTLKSQPAVAKAVIAALEKANQYIASHREDAVAILAKEYDLKPQEMAAIMDVNRYTLRLDDQLVSDMDKLASFLHSIKRIPNAVHTRAAIDATVLKTVDPGLVQLK